MFQITKSFHVKTSLQSSSNIKYIFTNHEDTDDTSHSLSANDSLLSVNTDTILIATAAAAVADQLMISDIIILC